MRSSESLAHRFNNTQIGLSDNVRAKDSIRAEGGHRPRMQMRKLNIRLFALTGLRHAVVFPRSQIRLVATGSTYSRVDRPVYQNT